MANTTYETNNWETYGKWTLVALILVLFLVALIAAVWGWEQGYFDTVVPSRPKSNRAPSVRPSPSVNFSSYRSTLNAQMRATGTPPAYTPHHLEHGPTPQPTYRTHVSTSEHIAQHICPLPIIASPNPYASPLPEAIELDELPAPDLAATNPWETMNGNTGTRSRRTLEPIVNQSSLRVSTNKSGRSSVGGPGTGTPKSGAGELARAPQQSTSSTPRVLNSISTRSTGPSSLRSAVSVKSSSTNRSGVPGAIPNSSSGVPDTNGSISREALQGITTPRGALHGTAGNTHVNSSAGSTKTATISSQSSEKSINPKDIV